MLIDHQLADAGWLVQDRKHINLFAGLGIAVREMIMAKGHGRVDYLLYVDKWVVGVIEAKPVGATLSGVEWQSAMYAEGLPPEVRLKALTVDGRMPFVFEASRTETHFTNGYDPHPRARPLFNVPKPEALARILRDAERDPARPTWRAKVRALPVLDEPPMRKAQVAAIRGIEKSLIEQRFDRSPVQMATGAGKTYTAVTESYRLPKFGGFNRALFLVDRNNLGDQTLAEFQNYRTPDDGRRFTEICNVDKLTSAGMLGSTQVVISTIQRVFKALRSEDVVEGDNPRACLPLAELPVGHCPVTGPRGDGVEGARGGHRGRGSTHRATCVHRDSIPRWSRSRASVTASSFPGQPDSAATRSSSSDKGVRAARGPRSGAYRVEQRPVGADPQQQRRLSDRISAVDPVQSIAVPSQHTREIPAGHDELASVDSSRDRLQGRADRLAEGTLGAERVPGDQSDRPPVVEGPHVQGKRVVVLVRFATTEHLAAHHGVQVHLAGEEAIQDVVLEHVVPVGERVLGPQCVGSKTRMSPHNCGKCSNAPNG